MNISQRLKAKDFDTLCFHIKGVNYFPVTMTHPIYAQYDEVSHTDKNYDYSVKLFNKETLIPLIVKKGEVLTRNSRLLVSV